MTGWQRHVTKLNLDTKFHVVKGLDNCWGIKFPKDSILLLQRDLIDSRCAAAEMAHCLNDQRYLLESHKFPWLNI